MLGMYIGVVLQFQFSVKVYHPWHSEASNSIDALLL